MRSLVLFALQILPLSIAAQASAEETFASTTIGSFELQAETEIDLEDGQPYIGNVTCYAASEDISFSVDREGRLTWLHFSFVGETDEDGNRPDLALLGDGIWLYVDGHRFEYRNIGTPTRQFRDYEYRADPDDDGIMLPVWHGYQAVRERDSAPFMHMSRIYEQVIAARRLEWGFKSRDWKVVDRTVPGNQLPEGWETRRYPINKDRLIEALEWCTRQVVSEAAIALPSRFRNADVR